jgi:Cytidine and deoxycytidylate deaminase zinc-binding region.
MNLNLAKKIAMKSKREQRHASIIFDHGKPSQWGWNDDKNHSEQVAIGFQAWAGHECKGTTMFNIRLTAAGKIGLAKPCPSCMELLRLKKFRKVIYSTNQGTFEEIYL